MSHDDFILGYQSGHAGVGVSGFLILRLFFGCRIRERRVVIKLVGWAAGLLLLVGLSALAFFCLPTLWAILGAIIIFAVFLLGFFHQLSEVVVSTALANKRFYELTRSEGALCVSTVRESNLPKLPKVVPMRPPRRAQR
jgi:hypothetical protein